MSHTVENRILEELRDIKFLLGYIVYIGLNKRIEGFVIAKENHMAPTSPGSSVVFTATPNPAGLVPVTPPTWASSDETNAPITVDSTGLVATIAIPVDAVVDASVTLTINYTNPDGVVATGSTSFTITAAVTPPPPTEDITSFTIEQTA